MKLSVPKLAAIGIIFLMPLLMAAKKTGSENMHGNAPLPVTPASLIHASFNVANDFYTEMNLASVGVSYKAFELAMKGFSRLRSMGLVSEDSVISIVDFTKSSREKRLFVIDLRQHTIAFNTVVAHGRKSGGEYARSFSNKPSSNKSSLGFYITEGTYLGSNGYSLRLNGAERGINDKALARAIVMHGADYASEDVVNTKGYLGRSFGCPAVPKELIKQIIDRIKDKNMLFVYYPDPNYLKRSKILNG